MSIASCVFSGTPLASSFQGYRRYRGVADFMLEAKIQQELESRTTQMQEGEDDVDIPAIDTTTPNGQKTYMTRDQTYMLNSQINSFLCSCPLYLDSGNVCALLFLRNDGEDMKGRASTWTKFDHDIICRANGAARSVSDLPCSNNGGAADEALHSVLDLLHSRNREGPDGGVRPVSDLPRSRSFHRA